MRKYQQLLLLLISIFSVSLFLIYRSENNRLKYVLQVVNFFGRRDAYNRTLEKYAIMHLENGTKDDGFVDYSHPLPVWQQIGESFHAYSAYWSRNELKVNGKAVVVVASKRGAIVNFKCSLKYPLGKTINGKFKFFRLDESNINSNFSIFTFLCFSVRDSATPEKVTLTESGNTLSHDILLRTIKSAPTIHPHTAAICMNLAQFNGSSKFVSKKNILQFFLHHQIIGINDFLIYNGDAIPYNIQHILRKTSLNINYFPFNFPFEEAESDHIRQIIETDCLMRNTNRARYNFLLTENEFIYPNTKIDARDSLLRSLNQYNEDNIRFEIPIFAVCLDDKTKLLMDNSFYDPEVKTQHKLYIYKSTNSIETYKTISLTPSVVFAHRYIECIHISRDGLYDWRNSLREDFMQYLRIIHNEIDFLI